MIRQGRKFGHGVKPDQAILNRGHPIAQGLVGAWLFNEGGGGKAFDKSGCGNHGTLTNGPTWGTGRFGRALSFDGTDDFVNTSLSNGFSNTSFTVLVWVKTSSDGIPIAQDAGNAGWALRISGGTSLCFMKDSSGVGVAQRAGGVTLSDGKWHQMVAVFTSSTSSNANNFTTVYADGALNNGTLTQGSGVYAASSSGVTIAKRPSGNLITGLIDHALIFNRALSAGEIRQLYVDPFALFRRTVLIGSRPSSGTTQALAGSSTGASACTGALSVTKPLAGSSTGSSTCSGGLSVTKTLDGASPGSSTCSGGLSIEKTLAGSSTGTSTCSGTVTVTRQLAGSSTGQSDCSGALTVVNSVAGASAGTCTCSGALSIEKPLIGTMVGNSFCAGHLTVTTAAQTLNSPFFASFRNKSQLASFADTRLKADFQ